MKRQLKVLSFIFLISIFISSFVLAQETTRGERRERLKQWIQKRQETSDYVEVEEDRVQALYDRYEKECVQKGWQKIEVNVNGLPRKILWKGPEGLWKYGAIIAMHGGGGTYSNYCANIRLGEPMVEFGDLAIKEGFAVFSLDSTEGLMTDLSGNPCGKRWNFIVHDDKQNIDLSFIEIVITETIPKLRPANSAKDIFITGISNGGFMTILAATYFADKITAFASVSAGDPYGTYVDCSSNPAHRQNAPGLFLDRETNKPISETNACAAKNFIHEKKWPEIDIEEKPPFKQFHHQTDGVCDISCMEKVRQQLVKHGYRDEGSFILKDTGRKRVLNHFWVKQYNQPLIKFFKKYAAKNQ